MKQYSVEMTATDPTIPAETVRIRGFTGLRILRIPTEPVSTAITFVNIVGLCPARRV
jgi:hypothetical protein